MGPGSNDNEVVLHILQISKAGWISISRTFVGGGLTLLPRAVGLFKKPKTTGRCLFILMGVIIKLFKKKAT